MSKESKRHGASASDASGGWDSNVARVLLTSQQLNTATAESLRVAWRAQHSYIDHLEVFNKLLKGSLKKEKEIRAVKKQQYAELQRREKILIQRLAAQEHQIQDYVSQITELQSSRASPSGRASVLDPAVNMLIVSSETGLDEFLEVLDEDVEGRQGTVLFLQQELRASTPTVNGNRGSSPVDKQIYSGSECSDRMRSSSVLSLFYNEEEEPLTDTNGEDN